MTGKGGINTCPICGEKALNPHFPNKWSLARQPDGSLGEGHKEVDNDS